MDIPNALASLAALVDIAKTAIDARDDAKLRVALSDMAARLVDAQTDRLDLLDRLERSEAVRRQLELQLQQLRTDREERERYVVLEVRPGAYVRALQPREGLAGAAHHLCHVCFDEGRHSILQRSLDGRLLRCLADARHDITLAVYRRGQHR